MAMPPIVVYWKPAGGRQRQTERPMTSGMMMPTESVVIANIANIA